MSYDSNYIISRLNRELEKEAQVKSEQDVLALLKGVDGAQDIEEKMQIACTDLRLKIAEHLKLDKAIFLFGNGASLYAGSKDTRKFDIAKYAPKYEKLGKLMQKLAGAWGIEEQMNELLITRAYLHVMENTRKISELDKLISEIKEELINSFVNSLDYDKLYFHEVFLLKLRSFGCLTKSEIFTSNYDLAFEYTMDKWGIDYEDGFSGFVNRKFDSRKLHGRNQTALVKIHGSVNWVTENGEVKEYQPSFEGGKVIIEDTDPVLIYPTSDKLYQTYASPYSELMRYMLDEMGTERNVIFTLGYKYGDEHINEILFKSLKNSGNIFYFFVFEQDEKNEFVDRLRKLSLSQANINIVEGKVLADFRNFVKYILPGIPEKTDYEKALDLLKKVLVENED